MLKSEMIFSQRKRLNNGQLIPSIKRGGGAADGVCAAIVRSLAYAFVLLAITAGQSSAAGIHSSAGTTALNFLKTGVGARPAALASAYTALSDDATACFWNPAGLTDAQAHEVFLTHHRFIADISQSAAAYIFEVRRVKVGLSMNYFGMGEMERREVNSVNPEGVFSPFDLALGVSAAYRVTELVSAGVTARWVHENLDSETAGMMLFDFGIKSNTVIPGLTAAISIRNLGGRLEFESQGYEAPREIAVGAAWRKGLPWAGARPFLLPKSSAPETTTPGSPWAPNTASVISSSAGLAGAPAC